MIFYPCHHHHPISQNLLNGIQEIKITKSYIFNLCLKIRLINGKFGFGKELRVLLWLLNEGQDLITYHSKWELPLIDWDCPIHGGRREKRSGLVTQVPHQGCSGNGSSCGWECRLEGPSWLRNHAPGTCLNMWVLTNEQTWETQAWASPSRQAGSMPAWACCPDPGRHGDSLQERQVVAAIKAQTGKHLVSLVHWRDASLTLNGIEKLEWSWISLCGTLTIQPVREFIQKDARLSPNLKSCLF